MEFFVCPCTATGNVILDGADQGRNKGDCDELLTKMCNEGLHTVSLVFDDGRVCSPAQRTVEIVDTDPVCPLEVPFECV